MQEPMPINLMKTDEVRANGWAAEERDKDGHLISTHAPFSSHEERVEYQREAAAYGNIVVFFDLSN